MVHFFFRHTRRRIVRNDSQQNNGQDAAAMTLVDALQRGPCKGSRASANVRETKALDRSTQDTQIEGASEIPPWTKDPDIGDTGMQGLGPGPQL